MKELFMLLFYILFILKFYLKISNAFLMYPPQATSFTVTASVSVPVVEYFPERRILIDWCFNMGYNLPSHPSQFYNTAIWPVRPKYKRDLLMKISNDTYSDVFKKYENDNLSNKRHSTDLTAGELYQGIEDFLVNYGFHETCLLRTVCELARHPFDDQHQNIVTDILTFFLTPSLHEGFDATEQLYREVYGQAEEQGFYGGDCAQLYAECRQDLLMIVSKVIFPNE